jgi:hypothetical protein
LRPIYNKDLVAILDTIYQEDQKYRFQIFGSQIGRNQETGEYNILPLIDPDNLYKRFAEVEIGRIQDYISNWGITWNVEDYKKKLPEYEMKQRNYLKTKQ